MDGHPRGLKFVKANGELVKLPPGFRFEPTEQELVFQYLQRKIFCLPLPASVIPELPNIYRYDPWNLPGDNEQEDKYFFSNKEAAKYYQTNKMMSSSGYWKSSSSAEKHIIWPDNSKIISSPTSMVIGVKKTMVFYYGMSPHGSKTDWIMHEYHLAGVGPAAENSPPAPQTFSRRAVHKKDHSQGSSLQHIANLVVCHVFQKKRRNGKAVENAEVCGDNININNNNNINNYVHDNVEQHNLMMMRDRLSNSCSYDGDDDDDSEDSCNLSSSSSNKVINE